MTLLVLHSVWWTFALYHLGVCVLLPFLHTVLWSRQRFGSHLETVGLAAPRDRLRRGLAWGIGLGLFLGVGTVGAFSLWHEPFLAGRDIPAILESWGVDPARAPLMLAFMVLGNGACEELYWRGWLHRRLAAWPRRGAALAITAAAYTSYHGVTVAAFTASPAVVALFMASIFGAGLFFGWLRERFGTVWPPLLAHTGATAGYMAVYLLWVA
jgi:membrane protease YdiL (CAAX protease family)